MQLNRIIDISYLIHWNCTRKLMQNNPPPHNPKKKKKTMTSKRTISLVWIYLVYHVRAEFLRPTRRCNKYNPQIYTIIIKLKKLNQLTCIGTSQHLISRRQRFSNQHGIIAQTRRQALHAYLEESHIFESINKDNINYC